jgi:outer membrane protein, heavy metal efflux system
VILRTKLLIAILVVVGWPVSLTAQQAPSEVGLDEALRLFAENNLRLRIARSRAAEASGLARQAGAFPNPTVSATHEPLSGDGRSYSESYLNLSQRFELPGERAARADAGRQGARAATLLVRADSLGLAFDVKRVFVEARLASERLEVFQRVAEVFREAVRSAEERYASGDISAYDLRRIQVERARYETLLGDAELELGDRERALALLVAPDDEEARLAAAPLPSVAPPAVPAGMLEGRPEVRAAAAEVEAADARARLSRTERIPDVTATGGFKRQSDGLTGLFLGLSLPVPLFDRGGGAVEAADAGTLAAEARLALVRREVDNDARRTGEAYRTMLRRAEMLSEAAPAAAGGDLLEIASVAYTEGEMELLELLDAADAYQQALAAEARRRAELWIAYYDLERALGGFDAATAPMEDGR